MIDHIYLPVSDLKRSSELFSSSCFGRMVGYQEAIRLPRRDPSSEVGMAAGILDAPPGGWGYLMLARFQLPM